MKVVLKLSLAELESEKMGRALSRAFYNEPNFTYIIPDDQRRPQVLNWFFGMFVARLGVKYGEVYAPEDHSGGAVWIKPGEKVSSWGAIRAGLLKMPFHFRFDEIKRSLNLSSYIEQIRQEYAPRRHWYLMALGVDPAMQSVGLGSSLIYPVLSQADAEGTECYLETFSQRGRKFYKNFGFKVITEHRVPEGGPNFWSMSRKPQTA